MRILFVSVLSIFLSAGIVYSKQSHQEHMMSGDYSETDHHIEYEESKIKEINLEAYQFGYEPEEIVVKKGDIVRLLISSRDVVHEVYIKEYGISARAEKGKIKKVEFIARKSGKFPILCSVYCGRGHSGMKAVLIVEE